MNSNYFQLIHRLISYREKLNKTQHQMGQLLGVTQSHYAKLESGQKIISFKSLKNFEKHDGDINYLITGSTIMPGKINEYLSFCKTDSGKIWLYEGLVWIFEKGFHFGSIDSSTLSQRTYKNLLFLKEYNKTDTIWECIRKSEDLSQINMAKIFDIDVKRYRRIEKLISEPDAEILNTLYCKLHYSPLIITNQELFYLDELNQAWELFPENIKETLNPLLRELLVFIHTYEKALSK